MKEGLVYLNILQYIKENGISDFNHLFSDIDRFYFTKEDILEELVIFNRAGKLDTLIENNIKLIGFLRSLRHRNIDFFSKEFRYFIKNVERNMDKLSTYIDNARRLVSLDINTINFANLDYGLFNQNIELRFDSSNILMPYINDDGEKIYFKSGNIIASKTMHTDGIVKLISINNFSGRGTTENPYVNCRIRHDENYKLLIRDASFILENEKDNNKQFSYITIKDFGFDSEKLPNDKELNSYKEPEYIKQYKKTFRKL